MRNMPFNLPPLPTASEMRQWDKNSIAFGISETMLMENAGRALFSFMENSFYPLENKKILLFMGGGNNGGDAACLARHLHDAGAQTLVLAAKNPDTLVNAAKTHYDLARKDGVKFININPEKTDSTLITEHCLMYLQDMPDCIVDGLLGTGFTGNLKAEMRHLISAINDFAKFTHTSVMAIDAPSGLDSNTGHALPVAIKATHTICLAAAKAGLVLPHAQSWTGQLIVRQIGIPCGIERRASFYLLDGRIFGQSSFPQNGFKNIYGHVMVIGGSKGLEGAPRLAAFAALRSGAGLVTVCAPDALCASIKADHPEIMTCSAGEAGESIWPEKISEDLAAKITSMQALVIGPGMGRTKEGAKFLQNILEIEKRPPAVIDADALMHLSAHRDLLQKLRNTDILTPHPGEAAMLLGSTGKNIQMDRPGHLHLLCQLSEACVILKGAATLTGQRNRPSLLAPYDIPQMSIAGAGDVLAGCLGAQMAFSNEADVLLTAGKAVIIHMAAGMICAKKFPGRGALAGDLANALSEAETFINSCDKTALRAGQQPWP